MSVNKAILVGRLGRDPEMRYTGGGTPVANFSIATDETFKDRNGQKQTRTEWHKIIAWGKLAEIVKQYCTKGQLVYIEGQIGTREWEKDGVKRYTTEITARNLRMLGGKGRDNSNDSEDTSSHWDEDNTGRQSSSGSTKGTAPEINDEDIPF